MTKQPLELLNHIRDECIFLVNNSVDIEIEDLRENGMMRRAFIRSIEVIGEASKSIPDDFKMNHNEIPWKEMSGMRDILIHRYGSVDLDIVLDVIMNKIPPLLDYIVLLIDEIRRQ